MVLPRENSPRLARLGGLLQPRFWLEDRADDLRGLPGALAVGALSLKHFLLDGCLLRAAALTYTTLLALIPLLAFGLAVFRGFGLHESLLRGVLSRLAPGPSQQLVEGAISLVARVDAAALGAAGLLLALATVLVAMNNVERAFNHIWGVRRPRPLARRVADYLSILLVAPLLLGAALSLTTLLQSQRGVLDFAPHWMVSDAALVLLRVFPFLAVWVVLGLLYLLIPNAEVEFGSAALAGVVAGTLWQFTQWAYISFQFGLARYQAIYGTLAQLPVLMVWLFLSWSIVFAGAELAYAHQHRRVHHWGKRSELYEEEALQLALRMAAAVARSFRLGEPPWTEKALAEHLKAPASLLAQVTDRLKRRHLLVEVAGGDAYLLPARDPAQIHLLEVADAVQTRLEASAPEAPLLERCFREMALSRREAFGRLTLEACIKTPEENPSAVGAARAERRA
ncbi:MAG: YihY/virulence factor BrkB family protein [Nitrospinota bacterium]